MSKNTEKVEVALTIYHETEKAVLVSEDDKTKIWLPLSQIEITRNADGSTASIEMPLWLAEKSKFAGY